MSDPVAGETGITADSIDESAAVQSPADQSLADASPAAQSSAAQSTAAQSSANHATCDSASVAVNGLPRSIWTWLLWLQLVLLTGVWLSIVAIEDLPNSLEIVDVFFFGILVWQCEALGFWMGLGRTRWRLILVPAATITLAMLCSIAANGELPEFLVFVSGIVFVVAATTLVLRYFAGTLARVADTRAGSEALQFGIQHVMVWTLLVAVLFCLGRYVIEYSDRNVTVDGFAEIFVLAAGMSGSTVVLVWALLGRGVQLARLAGMLTVMVAATLLTQYLSEWWPFTVSTIVAQLLLVATLILLRMDRFRFLKHASDSPAASS